MSSLLHSPILFCAAASGSLLASIWQGLLLSVGVSLCFRAIPGLTASLRSAVWTAVFLLIVLLPALPRPTAQSAIHAVAASQAGHLGAIHIGLRWSFALACVWLLLSLVRASRLVSSVVALRRLTSRAMPVEDGGGFAALLRSGPRPAALCTSPDVDRPSVIGFFSPRILLPADLLASLDPAELEQVLLHELEHLRRADDWRNLLQKLALVLFPLDPVLLWIERHLSLEREIACDERVLRLTHSRKAYASCLTRLAEHSLVRRGASLALGAWERRPELVSRVHRILNGRASRLGPVQLRLIAGSLFLSISSAAVLLARSPILVSFAPAEQPAISHPLASSLAPSRRPETSSPRRSLSGNTEHFLLARAEIKRDQVPAARLIHASFHVPARRTSAARRPTLAFPVLQSVDATQHQLHQPPPAWVLTGWQSAAVPILIQGNRSSYAAVPTPDGWILLQL